jgi:long-chain acyl-CoA synthetase
MEAAAIGVPVNSTDQRTKAFVVVKDGQTLTEQEVIEWCKEGLSKYKVPKYVEFRKELPKSMVGKILRRQLIEDEEKKETATA